MVTDLLEISPLRGFGTGFAISDNLIVTSYHVIHGAETITTILPEGDIVEAEVVDYDPEFDIALLRVEYAKLKSVNLGDSDKLKVGQLVLAIGYPLGMTDQPTVTLGVISALGRTIRVGNTVIEELIQTDASINPGNSGGPLLNLDGEVVGINTAIVATAQGIGFAIPINIAKIIIEELNRIGRIVKPRLGFYGLTLSKSLTKYYNIPTSRGVLVVQVIPETPAYYLGIKPGDVITHIDDEEIDTITKLKLTLIKKYLEGKREMYITILRGRSRYRLRLYLT
ncbi:MAG: peptidase S1 [Thermoprotei archaeon ex4572_64]|nr:MAG: peptidase S1 [Thermoprotei archaeon ex4572_64]